MCKHSLYLARCRCMEWCWAPGTPIYWHPPLLGALLLCTVVYLQGLGCSSRDASAPPICLSSPLTEGRHQDCPLPVTVTGEATQVVEPWSLLLWYAACNAWPAPPCWLPCGLQLPKGWAHQHPVVPGALRLRATHGRPQRYTQRQFRHKSAIQGMRLAGAPSWDATHKVHSLLDPSRETEPVHAC